MSAIKIRKATSRDHDQIWEIIREVIRSGETFVFAPDTDRSSMLNYWCGNDKFTYSASIDDRIVGTFIINDNQPGLGSHVANASYMTLPTDFKKGIGKAMGVFSIDKAKRLGYEYMQFNSAVKSNERAVALWKKLGFKIVGEVPEAFNHKKLGLTNAYIMWRKL